MARFITEAMLQDLKVPFIVENVPGAGGLRWYCLLINSVRRY